MAGVFEGKVVQPSRVGSVLPCNPKVEPGGFNLGLCLESRWDSSLRCSAALPVSASAAYNQALGQAGSRSLAAESGVEPGGSGVEPEGIHRLDVAVGEGVDAAPAVPQVRAAPPRVAQAGHARRAAGAVDHHGRVADHERAQLGGGVDIDTRVFAGVGLHAGVDEVHHFGVVFHVGILRVHVIDPVAQLAAEHVVHRVVGGHGIRERRAADMGGLDAFALARRADENVGRVQVRVEQLVPGVEHF